MPCTNLHEVTAASTRGYRPNVNDDLITWIKLHIRDVLVDNFPDRRESGNDKSSNSSSNSTGIAISQDAFIEGDSRRSGSENRSDDDTNPRHFQRLRDIPNRVVACGTKIVGGEKRHPRHRLPAFVTVHD